MNYLRQLSDINLPSPPVNSTNHERLCRLDSLPPGYVPKMKSDEESLVDKLEEQYGSLTCYGYIKTCIILLFGSVGCLMMLVICVGIPPSMIVMGALYLDACPIQPYIPIYLIAGGSFSLCSAIFAVLVRMIIKDKDDEQKTKGKMALLGIANLTHCFSFAWFFAGCSLVYGIYEPSYDPRYLYCDKTVYLFCFWLLNSIFIVISGLLLLGLFMLLCSLIGGENRRFA